MAFEGRLQQWDDARGFGFIEVESAPRERVFVHASALPRDGTRPALGARLVFDVERDERGRKRAVNVRLADARSAVARTSRPESRPAPPGPRLARRSMPRRPVGRTLAWGVVALVAAVAVASWRTRPMTHAVVADRPAPGLARPLVDADAAQRGCDGRTRCSQMTSCAEATWFLQHCPGAQMDGNHDGVPCEQQWCGAR